MDRRDFLAAWIQALLLAIFPFLRERPAAAKALAGELADRQLSDLVEAIKNAKQCPIYNMPVIEQVRWTLTGPLADGDVRKHFGDEVAG